MQSHSKERKIHHGINSGRPNSGLPAKQGCGFATKSAKLVKLMKLIDPVKLLNLVICVELHKFRSVVQDV